MEVDWADQQKINEFSKLNSRLLDNEKAEKKLKQQKEDLEDLEMEIELLDEDERLLYSVGDAFVYLEQKEIVQRIEKDKADVEEKLEAQGKLKEGIASRMETLKTELYAKFGRENINLERD